MKPSHLLLLTAAALLPGAAFAKQKASSGSGKGLPPKFGGLIQPAPAPDAETAPGGVISSDVSGKDLEFLTQTIELGRLQSWLVKTAQEKAETPEVRALGGALAEIQLDENKYVAKLASMKGVVIPGANAPAPAQQKLAAKIKGLSGPKLEKALVEEIVNTAEKSVALYEAARESRDADIKLTAERMLPPAKSRLDFASRSMGRAQNTSTRPTFRTGGNVNAAPDNQRPEPSSGATPPTAPRTGAPAPTSNPASPGRGPRTEAPASGAPTPRTQPPAAPARGAGAQGTTGAAAGRTPVSSAPAAVPAPPAPGSFAPGATPPPRPPKPTPVSERAVLPGRPTPPDFGDAALPPAATPAPAAAPAAAAPPEFVADDTPAATPASGPARKRK